MDFFMIECDMCGGIGSYVCLPGDEIATCPYCNGKGEIHPDDPIPYFPTKSIVQ